MCDELTRTVTDFDHARLRGHRRKLWKSGGSREKKVEWYRELEVYDNPVIVPTRSHVEYYNDHPFTAGTIRSLNVMRCLGLPSRRASVRIFVRSSLTSHHITTNRWYRVLHTVTTRFNLAERDGPCPHRDHGGTVLNSKATVVQCVTPYRHR
jgi:hypothetical protein